MTTTLSSFHTKRGVEKIDADGKVVFLITYNKNFWHVGKPGESGLEATSNLWLTLEAAEFYALALYANDVAIEAADAARLDGNR